MPEPFAGYGPDLLVVLSVFAVGAASPGPATLTILDLAVSRGRRQAIALSLGVVTGSMAWATVAALGFAATFGTSVVLFTAMKLAGGLYLLYLAVGSLRSAMTPGSGRAIRRAATGSCGHGFLRGLLLHLTNPKAPLVWLATLSAGLDGGDRPGFLVLAVGSCAVLSVLIFVGYAILFSTETASRAYAASRRPFDLLVGVLFGAAAIRLLCSRAP